MDHDKMRNADLKKQHLSLVRPQWDVENFYRGLDILEMQNGHPGSLEEFCFIVAGLAPKQDLLRRGKTEIDC